MHELSIAMNIVEICEKEARKAGSAFVSVVEVEVGVISGVIPDALEFSWDVATKETLLEGAKLKITEIKAIARCAHCRKEFEMEDTFQPCPDCQRFGSDILSGQELKIRAISVE